MRVISGTAKGTRLKSIENISTRPTLDRVKESIFNILQSKIANTVVLDLFAGSGAISIEFLSRGAKKAYLGENNKIAVKMIYENLKKTKLEANAVVINSDYKKVLNTLKNNEVQFDFAYIDPPYESNIAIDSIKRIIELNLIKENGILIIETDDEERELLGLKNLKINIKDIRKYGRVSLIFIEKNNS